MLKKIRSLALILSLVIIAAGAGYRFGSREYQVKLKERGLPTFTFSNEKPPPEIKNVNLGLFWDVWKKVSLYYVDKSRIDPQKMVYGAISGMVASLEDPYTVFLTPQQNKETKEELGGHFEGIGAQLGIKDKRIVVIAPLKDSPAENSGIRAGDWIIKVNGKDTYNWTLPEAVSKIRGAKGTVVTLTVLHDKGAKTVDLNIARDTIIVKSAEWSKKDSIAYLKLSRFGDGTNAEWDKAVSEIAKLNCQKTNSDCRGVILDVRNNPGGYLSGAIYTASEFLGSGVIVKQEESGGQSQTHSVNRNGKLTTVPLVVLINKGSASASEILAGAIQSRNRGKLVGEKSFGKGSVQQPIDLPEGAGLHVTTAKWLLPNNQWINGSGLEPDVIIENDDKDPTKDLQLEKAIGILNNH